GHWCVQPYQATSIANCCLNVRCSSRRAAGESLAWEKGADLFLVPQLFSVGWGFREVSLGAVLNGAYLREISLVNKSLATESTEKHGIFNKSIRVFRGFRGHSQGSAFK
ncbi:MAG: hypothetical protein PVH54_13725, partial [Gammaproteobacteria bacterium]